MWKLQTIEQCWNLRIVWKIIFPQKKVFKQKWTKCTRSNSFFPNSGSSFIYFHLTTTTRRATTQKKKALSIVLKICSKNYLLAYSTL